MKYAANNADYGTKQWHPVPPTTVHKVDEEVLLPHCDDKKIQKELVVPINLVTMNLKAAFLRMVVYSCK